MPAPDALRVSAVVPTRNRAAHAAACAETILRNPEVLELIVIDQSDDRSTEQALAPLRDPRLRYVRSELRGVCNGRNTGIELSQGEIIAFTDDDCRVPPDWAVRVAGVFAADPEAAVVCGRVHVPDEILQRGYAEGFEPQQREWKGRYPPLGRDWGITANMALRRAALARIGTFDPMLGAGGPLRSGGEPDLVFRTLRAGFKVVNASEVLVDHLGVRAPGEETRRLILGYAAGTAAAMFKHVRLGDAAGTAVYLRFLGSSVRLVLGNLLRGRRPLGLGYLGAFISGSLASYRFRVDRTSRLYARR